MGGERRRRHLVAVGGETRATPSCRSRGRGTRELELAVKHFHRNAPVDEDDEDKMLLLNKPDDLDDKADNTGAANNSPTPKVRPPAAVAAVTPTPMKRGRPHKHNQRNKKSKMGFDKKNKTGRNGILSAARVCRCKNVQVKTKEGHCW